MEKNNPKYRQNGMKKRQILKCSYVIDYIYYFQKNITETEK